jgi:LuxR family maltose regulon positive regulatory protein
MSIPIMITKVLLPSWREEILSRKRLTSLFDELLDRKLIIISAPAGYGKTSLLLDVAHHNELPFCWYTLDSLDQDIDQFLAHFITSISRQFPAFGQQSLAVLERKNQEQASLDQLSTVIVNEIYQSIREHFVIVLDDYQMVDENPTINDFINRFIQNVDQNCHLAITSRSTLPLPDLSLMVGRSLVGGLGLAELAFQPDEIQALMLKNYQQVIPDAIALELAQKTEGWITGLLLSAQTMWKGMVNQLRLTNASGVDLYDYLMEQVFNQQTPILRDFMLKTSFLDEFNLDLCYALMGDPPAKYTWEDILEHVLKHNLFMLPIGESGDWFHYHRLFSDFLQAQFMKENPAEVDPLLRKLIDIFTEREEWEKAYIYCQRLGKPEVTADLLEKAGEIMVLNGRISLLKRWLEGLPVNIVDERPILLARYGIVLATQTETNRGLNMVVKAINMLRLEHDHVHLAGALVWRALIHFLRGEYQQALADVDEVFSIIVDLHDGVKARSLQAEAHRISGQCQRMMGNMPAARDSLNQALELFKRIGDQSGINRVLLLLGLLNLDAGNFKNAIVYYQQVLDYYQKRVDIFSSSSVLNDIAYIHYLQGEYIEAFTTFNHALVQARQSGNARVEGLVLIGLGDIFFDLNDFSEAVKAYQQGCLIAESIKDASLLIYISLAKTAVARYQGKITQASIHLDSARMLIEETKSGFSQGQYLLQAGLIQLAKKDYSTAIQMFNEANSIFLAGEQRVDEIRVHGYLSAALFKHNRIDEASRFLAQASDLAADLKGRNILIQAARQSKEIFSEMAESHDMGLPAIRLQDDAQAFDTGLPQLKRKLRAQDTLVIVKPPMLRIQAFGHIQVLLDEKPVSGADWQVLVTRDLLFLMLNNRRGWGKEQIGEFLWPESSPSQLNQRFKNTIYRLRRAVNLDVIQYSDGIYTFNRKIDYFYDVEEFENYLDQAGSAPRIEEQIDLYQAAIQLYQGDYLPGMDWEWVLPERERLQQAFLNSGVHLAELYINIKQFPKALEICDRLINVAPWLEEAYRIAMNLHAFKGNRAAIAQLYKGLQQGLWEYMDSSPSEQTENLYRSLII